MGARLALGAGPSDAVSTRSTLALSGSGGQSAERKGTVLEPRAGGQSVRARKAAPHSQAFRHSGVGFEPATFGSSARISRGRSGSLDLGGSWAGHSKIRLAAPMAVPGQITPQPRSQPNPALSRRLQPLPASTNTSIGETGPGPATNRPSRVRSIRPLVCCPCAVGFRVTTPSRPTASTRMPLNPCSRTKSRS